MNRTAIATWKGYVATTLDFARTLVLVDVEDGKVTGKRDVRLAARSLQAIAARLDQAGAQVVICGAISAPLLSAIEARGIRVISFVRGGVEEVIRGCMEGRIEDERFHMAGCRPCGDKSAKHRRRTAGPQCG